LSIPKQEEIMSYKLTIPETAYIEVLELDKTFVGTNKYMGLAYFWAHEYRHYLRDTTDANRRRVHSEFLTGGMELNGVSSHHESIIEFITRKDKIK
jgi:hypothetical protein